jgi:anthranilate synthase component 1
MEISIFEHSNKKLTTVYAHEKISNIIPSDIFETLKKQFNQKKAFMLESNLKGEKSYIFMGFNPLETIRIKDELTYLEKDDETKIIVGNPVNNLENFLYKYQGDKISDLPPFYGGVTGYIGYDFVRYLEKIKLPETNLFEESEACLMLFDEVIAIDHENEKVFVIINILDKNNDEKIKLAKKRIIDAFDIINTRISKNFNNELPKIEELLKTEALTGLKTFEKEVATLKKHIKNGDIFQAVIAEKFTIEIDSPPLEIYKVLKSINPSPYLFYLETGLETILGSSPEMLVKVENQKLQVCPIAGTRPRGIDKESDQKFEKSLNRSTKEKAEHLMLVDLARNDLGRVSKAGSVKVVDFMQTERFSSVMHLVSRVEGQLKDEYKPFDAFKACFPAGTLSGAPKVRAMQIIYQQEQVRRGVYGGSILCHGFSNYLDSCIAIRFLYLKGNKGYIQAGAGVVQDSRAIKEYEEIINKSKAVLKAVTLTKKLLISGGLK